MGRYDNPEKGEVYISPELADFFCKDVKNRIISKLIDSDEAYAFTNIKGERVIRFSGSATTEIKATFHVDNRDIKVLTIQGYTVATDKPHNANFSFVGDEIDKLLDFAKGIKEYQFKSKNGEVVISSEFTKHKITDQQLYGLVVDNEVLLKQMIESDIRSEDLIAIGYRKKQLECFRKLLVDENYFDSIKIKRGCNDEALWQNFFEKNPWIFGYGLGYIFMSNLDDKKIEQIVKGYDFNTFGKRADGVLKSRGIISNLCFVEIKTHKTELLQNKYYRVGCWAPSKELSGAIAQVRGTVFSALNNYSGKICIEDKNGNLTNEEIYNNKPKAYLIIGSLGELITDNGVNKNKLRSLELYRNNINDVEIITYDELYERARFIVENNKRI
jgi:hypothetical protein